MKRTILAALPNGDWTQWTIELYGGNAIDLCSEKAALLMSNGLTWVLLGTNFEVISEGRWLANETAIDRCGLLEAVHGLGRSIFKRFADNDTEIRHGRKDAVTSGVRLGETSRPALEDVHAGFTETPAAEEIT